MCLAFSCANTHTLGICLCVTYVYFLSVCCGSLGNISGHNTGPIKHHITAGYYTDYYISCFASFWLYELFDITVPLYIVNKRNMNLSDVKLVDSEFAFVCTEWVHSCKLFCTLYLPCLRYRTHTARVNRYVQYIEHFLLYTVGAESSDRSIHVNNFFPV